MRYFYRCAECKARRVLPRMIERYKNSPKCNTCGSERFYIDWYRMKQYLNGEGAYERCKCGIVWYPHRPGSIDGCKFSDKPVNSEAINNMARNR